jgi:hypothetical protein
MKGSLSRLLLAALMVSSVYAKVHHDKTYLLPRSQGVSLEKEYVTWHKHLNMSSDERVGGSIQVVPFYQDSSKHKKAGQYFGVENEARETDDDDDDDANTIDNFVGVIRDGVAGSTEILNPLDVFHISSTDADLDALDPWSADNANLTLRDEVRIKPESKSVGARIDYHQKLDCLLKGLFFKVNVPVVNNKTSVHAKTKKDITQGTQKLATGALTGMDQLANEPGTAKSMLDYLAGNVSSTDSVNGQDALKYAKIVSGHHSKTGVADVDLTIGYNFLREDNYRVGLNFGVTFPTGNKPNAEFLFGPRVGTNHWGVGAGFDTAFRMWHSDCCSLELLLVGNFRYLFKDKEMRTAGYKWTQYKLGDKSTAVAGDAFFPLANVLTRHFDVTPGSQFDMIANLAFTWKGFTFDLGYNLYVRSAEHVRVRDWDTDEEIYGVASRDSNGSEDFDSGEGSVRSFAADEFGTGVNGQITREIFDENFAQSVKTPGQLTNKIYAAVGYSWNEWEYPVLVGVFGGYEFTDNAALEQWNVGGKVGVTF